MELDPDGQDQAKTPLDPRIFSPTSRGLFLDLRPALDRARRAAHDRRVFCEHTLTVSEKKKDKTQVIK